MPRQRVMHPPKPPKQPLTKQGARRAANGAVIGFNKSAALIDPVAPKQAAAAAPQTVLQPTVAKAPNIGPQ